MKENLQNVACDRAEDLVAYLYGEASQSEAIEFKRHMEKCHSCAAELAAFSSVREDVIEWRNQSLPSFETSHAQLFSEAKVLAGKRSALDALREFFMLAPAWMRAATAMAAVAICALVVFTVAHFSEQPKTVVKVVPTAPTESQVNALVNERVEELRRKEQEAKAVPEPVAPLQRERTVLTASDNGAAKRTKAVRPNINSTQIAKQQQSRSKTDKLKASQEARQQLAELVQTTKEDDSLPRLSDLIEDSNESQ